MAIFVKSVSMVKKLETIDLKGNAYAKVAVRLKEFREMCTNGLIETTPTFLNDNKVAFKTRILKDKSDQNSGEGTGHSMGSLVKDGKEDPKAFEKLETISIGRALSVMGFMASGEVASFEEMEEFMSQKETERQIKIQEIKDEVDAIKNVDELREYFKSHTGYGVEVDQYITNRAKEIKDESA